MWCESKKEKDLKEKNTLSPLIMAAAQVSQVSSAEIDGFSKGEPHTLINTMSAANVE